MGREAVESTGMASENPWGSSNVIPQDPTENKPHLGRQKFSGLSRYVYILLYIRL